MNNRLSSILLVAALALSLVAVISLAQGPQLSQAREPGILEPPALAEIVAGSLSYQGRLLDGNGDPVDGTRTLTFGLYAEAGGGAPLWSEIHYDVALDNGYFAVALAVDVELFDGQELWLGVQVQGDAQELEPRQPMLPAPYALSLRPGANVRGSGLEQATLVIFSDDDTGLYVETSSGEPADAAIFADNKGVGPGAWVRSNDGYGLFAHSFNDIGVYAQSIDESAGFFQSVQGHGVYGYTSTDDPVVAAVKGQNDGLGPGVTGFSLADSGVYGESTDGHGIAGFSINEVGVYGQSLNTASFFTSTMSYGVHGNTISEDPEVAAVLGDNHGMGHGVVGLSLEGFAVAGFGENNFGVYGQSTGSPAGFFTSTLSVGVHANTSSENPEVAAVLGENWGAGPGVSGTSSDEAGVHGSSESGAGVFGSSLEAAGVIGESELGRGGEFFSSTWTGVFGYTSSDYVDDAGVKGRNYGSGMGVQGISADAEGGSFQSTNGTGVYGESVWGTAATFLSFYGPGIRIDGAGTEGLRIMDGVGGDYILAGSDEDFDFKVSSIGDVFADGSYHCGQGPGGEPGTCIIQQSPADFAEMLPAQPGLEPGDVLVIGLDGRLARSTQACQPTVLGVFSTQPGYLGGGQYEGQAGYAPLAVTGVVPVKASAENGPIRPGDLLVASDTPGHAMRAGPNPPVGTVIGKALASLHRGTGIILMLAMLQ